MAYKHSVYLKARDLMEKRRRKAESEQSARHSAAVARCPEIAQAESEMASHGAEAIKAVGMGGDVQQYILSIAKKNLEMQEKRKKLLLENGFPEDYLDKEQYHKHHTYPELKVKIINIVVEGDTTKCIDRDTDNEQQRQHECRQMKRKLHSLLVHCIVI